MAPTPAPKPAASLVPGDDLVYGYVTFDRVRHSDTGSLLYDDPVVMPAAEVTVELWDNNDTVLRRTNSDANGYYELGAPPDTAVRVVALARMESTGSASWLFEVVDNTDSNALYTLAGHLAKTNTIEEQRDLHAVSGWNSVAGMFDDTAVRPAAPFAILATVRMATTAFIASDSDVQLPSCRFGWSYLNTATPGDQTLGEIGTTYYDSGDKRIYVLGHAYNDTDEYDYSVLLHELAHFVEDNLSRSDSIGGTHALDAKLDMRLAFSEGFANAFAAIISEDPLYRDSAGSSAYQNLVFSLEENRFNEAGWYSENSVGKVLYDLADAHNEAGDALSLGFNALHAVMTDAAFAQSDAFSSIFLFREVFDSQHSDADRAAFNEILQRESIYGIDRYGSNELNDGGIDYALPVYHYVILGDSVDVCSSNVFGAYNGLGVNRYVYFRTHRSGSISVDIKQTRSSLLNNTDPDAFLYRNGELLEAFVGQDKGQEQASVSLSPGEYMLEVFEASNTVEGNSAGGLACFTVTID